MGVGWKGASVVTRRLWWMAVLAAAGAIGTVPHAEAALYYWSDSDPGLSGPAPTAPQRRQARRHPAKKIDTIGKESAKPQGPLIIAISIEKQNLRIYDANGFFAESPVSTGMRGHSTPMGVFSVIQKQKLHHSNIYSGAPMPYMQRITWSGIAIHAGVLPGYPASHGCIRMPMAFAMKMWNWTKMGARVVVTPGEMSPASFSHPLLVAQKAAPQPTAGSEPQADAPPAAKADKAAADVASSSAGAEANLELRSAVGHVTPANPVMAEPPASPSLREQTHTADAGETPATKAPVTMTDAAPPASSASPRDGAAIATSTVGDAASAKPSDASSSEIAKSEPAKMDSDAALARRDDVASSDNKAQTTTAPEAAEMMSAVAETKMADAAKPEASPAVVEKAEAPKPDPVKSSEKTDGNIKAATDTATGAAGVKKDQNRLPDPDRPVASKPDPAAPAASKRAGQIAVFISRKDAKLYVRQNFAPLFEAPVTIAPSDRPLGTHIFTAQIDKGDANVVHWSVVSLPMPVRYAERRDEDERVTRHRKMTGAVEVMKTMPVPDSPAEALDRLAIPADAMARITEALSTGASIIVSDQGINAGETGEGTDFIVSLR
jgi:hypothetical protein